MALETVKPAVMTDAELRELLRVGQRRPAIAPGVFHPGESVLPPGYVPLPRTVFPPSGWRPGF